jgi:hypothetical protein
MSIENIFASKEYRAHMRKIATEAADNARPGELARRGKLGMAARWGTVPEADLAQARRMYAEGVSQAKVAAAVKQTVGRLRRLGAWS